MRLEAIEKEADLYTGKGECYIHVERAGDSPITCIMNGDPAALMQATYNIICHMSEQMHKPFMEVLKMFKKAYRQFGVPSYRDASRD